MKIFFLILAIIGAIGSGLIGYGIYHNSSELLELGIFLTGSSFFGSIQGIALLLNYIAEKIKKVE